MNCPGEALVFWDHDDFRLLEWMLQDSERRREDLIALMKFLNSRECRLVGLRRYFDRVEMANGEGACGHCDICRGHFRTGA